MSQNEIKVSEIFRSYQGEGRFVGVPSVFLRTFGCNFTCSGFGMPAGERSFERMDVDAKAYTRFADLPVLSTGCDSYPSWDPRFRHLSPRVTVQKLAQQLTDLNPGQCWKHPVTGVRTHLVITGGEPLLGWQKSYPALLDQRCMQDLMHVTFETNGTQFISDTFANYIRQAELLLTFSISPKLSVSGEPWNQAIRPDVVASYEQLGVGFLKFVVDSEQHFDEVDTAVAEYRAAGFVGQVYVMPEGGTLDQLNKNSTSVANWALARGYCFSPRLHVLLWNNGWGK